VTDVTLIDSGNPFLGPDYPAVLTTGRIQTPAGERLCLTILCGSATPTVTMDQGSAKEWAAQIEAEASNMTGLILPNGQVNLRDDLGRQP